MEEGTEPAVEQEPTAAVSTSELESKQQFEFQQNSDDSLAQKYQECLEPQTNLEPQQNFNFDASLVTPQKDGEQEHAITPDTNFPG